MDRLFALVADAQHVIGEILPDGSYALLTIRGRRVWWEVRRGGRVDAGCDTPPRWCRDMVAAADAVLRRLAGRRRRALSG